MQNLSLNHLPDTRDSLLLRLKNAEDRDAWAEFLTIYRPLVYRLARRRGFQDADAHDIVQRVLLAVAQQIEHWQGESGQGRFRGWLYRVAKNAIVDAVRRVRPDAAQGGTSVIERLGRQADRQQDLENAIEQEHRRELFRQAAREVRDQFEESTWLAFWKTAVEGVPAADAAEQLQKTVGAVYTARSRVMQCLQETIQKKVEASHAS